MTIADTLDTNTQTNTHTNISTQDKINSIIDARLLKENTQMAREMLAEGLDYTLISKVTGFDEEVITALSHEQP